MTRTPLLMTTLMTVGLLSSPLLQGAIDIPQSPMFAVSAAKPAMLMAVDDSGSMDFETLFRSNDGALWWDKETRSFLGWDGEDRPTADGWGVNFNKAGGADSKPRGKYGVWLKYPYLFPNGNGWDSSQRMLNDSSGHYAIAPTPQFGFARSPAYNLAYFDPATDYAPWRSLGGYTFEQSDPAQARFDPVKGSMTLDLTRPARLNAYNQLFRMEPGMVLPANTPYSEKDSTWKVRSSDWVVSSTTYLAIEYFPATFYLPEDEAPPSAFGYDPARAVSEGLGADGRPLRRYEIRPENFTSGAAYSAAINNFANWFTYYRKRHQATRGAIGTAFETISNFRIGVFYINKRWDNVPMRDMALSSGRDGFFDLIYSTVSGGGTPNREAILHMKDEWARTDGGAPVQNECQMNFGMLFTDGYANVSDTGLSNVDGGWDAPYRDSYRNTLADIAASMYENRPNSEVGGGKVPVPAACREGTAAPWVDCNRDPHVNFFALSLGAPGTVYDPSIASLSNNAQIRYPYDNPPVWPEPNEWRSPKMVDDLWHATINGRGLFLNVDRPAELGRKFKDLLAEIGTRLDNASSSAAASTSVLRADTLLFTAGFRTDDWSGMLTGGKLNPDGGTDTSCDTCWDAETQLAARPSAQRQLFTRVGGKGTALSWDNLDAATMQAPLRWSPDQPPPVLTGTSKKAKRAYQKALEAAEANGQARVAWLRGDDQPGLRYRDKTGVVRRLGDVLNSDPVYFEDVLYVGANDGFLHAFDARTGKELFGYMPAELLQAEPGQPHTPISYLMDNSYQHRYYVDGKISIGNIDGRRILIGTMGAGGRTVFALDITTPHEFGPDDVLWEFTDERLGTNTGQVQIARTEDGVWSAFLSSGANGTAGLFVLDALSGAPRSFTALPGATAASALGTPFVTDWPTRNMTVQRAFAGDLNGVVWMFDFSAQGDTPKLAQVLVTEDGNGRRQPITARPYAARLGATGDLMLVLGTGSYYRSADQADNQTQSLYGLRLAPGPVKSASRAQLLAQRIEQQFVHQDSGHTVRRISDYDLDAAAYRGWVLDLDTDPGERVITGPHTLGVNEQRVRFSTMIPNLEPCVGGLRGFFLDIDLASGGRTQSPVFDLNEDGRFDDADQVETPDTDENGDPVLVPVNGIDHGSGARVLEVDVVDETLQQEDYQLICDGMGRCERVRPDDLVGGRLSWREVRR